MLNVEIMVFAIFVIIAIICAVCSMMRTRAASFNYFGNRLIACCSPSDNVRSSGCLLKAKIHYTSFPVSL